MKYLSVCSGIEAATTAWHDMGWQPVAFSEIEPFPSRVLAYHYPTVSNLGDMTKYQEWNIEPIDLLVGGTPCQSFSVAGLRKGLADPRGNLALVYLGIADRFKPKWVVWENVPGVLSSNGGRDFGAFLGALAELGYGWAYRILDAQYFGVAQRRRRVFVVGCLGDWRSAAAVVFESQSLRGDSPPSRKARQEVTGTISSRTTGGGGLGTDFECAGGLQVAKCLTTGVGKRYDAETDTMIPIALAENTIGRQPQNGGNAAGFTVGGPMYTLNATGVHGVAQPIPFGVNEKPDVGHCLRAGASKADKHESTTYVQQSMAVRRLTPTECERLQGFPDGYTNIPWRNKPESPDGPRYKALGNSMAVPVMKWIGKRINAL